MPEHADEPAEEDLLLAFSTEPGGKPPESTESLAARVEGLERALQLSTGEIESLKSELATLVGTVDDIGKTARRHVAWAPKPVFPARSRFITVAASVVLGVALGLFGWAVWSRATGGTIDTIDTIDTTVAAAEPASEELPVDAPTPAPAVVSLAAAITPPPAPEPEPAIREPRRAPTPVDYVGTLSIDASPGGRVFIDRVPAGQTPLRVQNLKAGSHLVWIEREGYRRFTRVVLVPADRVSRVFADLEPIPER